MEEKKDDEKKNEEYKYIYFIDTHEKTKKFTFYFSDEYKGVEIENIDKNDMEKELGQLSSEIYRFKIIPENLKKEKDEKFQIIILADGENGKKYQYEIKFSDANRNNFMYDFNIEKTDFQPLSLEEQFEIYVQILKKKLKKKMESTENYNLILSTDEILDEKGKKYNFFFYLLIFLECFKTKLIRQHLLKFKPENIEGDGIFPEKKLVLIKNTLNILSKNPNNTLNIKDLNDKEELIEIFYSILLYFNIHFQKEKVETMFDDEKVFTYLSKKMISFHNLYKDLILPRDKVRNLLKKAETFEEILVILYYIGKDIIEFLQVIHLEMELIKDIYGNDFNKLDEENENKDNKDKKEMPKIEVEKYITPKYNDNIEKLYEVASLIFVDEKINNVKIIKFSQPLLGKYIDFYIGKSIINLQLLNNLIILIKKSDPKFEFNYQDKKMDLVIHETGIELIKRKEMKNNEILDFIKSDIYFIQKGLDKEYYRPLEILDGINIETLDDKFFITWLPINFNNIYEKRMNSFYDKILSLIKSMKDFGLLYKLFLFDNSKEYKTEVIKKMKVKYIELFPTYNNKDCPNFVEDTVKLISLVDQKKIETKDLLETIQNNLDFGEVNKIYIKLSDENKNLRDKTKDIIVKYFTDNKNNTNPESLVYLIKNCRNLRKDIFRKINGLAVTEFDFLILEETEKYKLYKGLIDNNIIDKEFEYKNADYLEKIMKTITSLDEKIKNFDIKYNDISIFFQNDENKKILNEKLKYLSMLDEIKQEKKLAQLEYKFNEIKNRINEFDLIYSYFRDFYYRKFEKDLDKLSIICLDLKINSLNYFENNLLDEYSKYSKYLEEANKRKNLQRSTFFNEILKHYQRNVFKADEDKALAATEKAFEKLKAIFKKGGISEIDEIMMEICIKPFQENLEKLKKELEILSELFNVKGNIEKTYEEILLFSKRGFIFNTASSIFVFLDNIKPKETDFLVSINDIINKMKENKDIETIKECENKMVKLKLFDGNEKDNKLFDILFKFKEQPKSIEFLLNTSIKDLNQLEEIASLNENNFVNVKDILDMEKCVEFFKDIGKLDKMKQMEDFDIIEKMNKKVSVTKDIHVYFEKYVNNYGQIKLLNASVDKSEALKYKIKAIFDGCQFLLANSKMDIPNSKELLFKCSYETKVKDEIKKIILLREEILSLRDKALLAKTITADYQYFIDSISEIINISNILKELFIKGYPTIITIKINYSVEIIKKKSENDNNEEIEINPKIICNIDEQNKNNFKEIIIALKNILTELKERQIKSYKDMPLIRYLYGRQFNLLYDKYDENNNNNNKIRPLLQYITNDSNKKEIKGFKFKIDGDLISNNINDWNNYLNEVLKANNLDLKKIYKPTLIKQKILNKNTGVFTHFCEQIEKNIFQIFKFLTGNNPIAQNILLCKKTTSNEELISFLYRAVLCEFNSCFILAGLENLETEKKSTIIELLNNFFLREKEKENMKSCLILLFGSNDSDIYKSLEMKSYRQILDLKAESFKNEKYEKNDIEIIKSDKSGVGKSTQIRLNIDNNKKKRIYFPFGGDFSREGIIYRLENLKMDDNFVLHLDLYDSDKTNSMMDFLFSILITRFYGQNEDIFFLPMKIEIKIEIPNTFINFFEKFPILNLFSIKEMQISNLAPLIVPPDITNNIEIVANYLVALNENKINEYDLIIPNFTPDIFQKGLIINKSYKKKAKTTSLMAKLFSAENCQNIIFNVIKQHIKEPNYYQIISFINVLAGQLRKLNKNFYLNALELINNNRLNILHIRSFIVNSFINLTSHFTEGAYTDILKSQDQVGESIGGVYNEKNDLEKAVNNLAKDVKDVISFEKINPSLVFFHEKTSQNFSIITNKTKKDKEYQDFYRLFNSQCVKKEDLRDLPDYKNYKQNDFLKELKDILDISNPVEKEPNNDKIALEEIAGDYVITSDNFVKMVLILLRIRAGIPVIMMGETGCGKTSLIRKLSEMKNEGDKTKMKILDIHAGTNDEDIIKFINEKVIPESKKIIDEEAEIKKERLKNKFEFEDTKLWVFLDEINTCKSMGLISELMCKHTCQGSPLPYNIVFIAACNPYRLREKKTGIKEEKIGLDINQAHNQIKQLNQKEKEEIIKSSKAGNLVYTVNPLPHSLLNFVFYFGALKPEDEKNYIKCIIRKVIEKIYYKGKTPKEEKDEDDNIKKLKNIACQMIWDAQEYIREKNDKSSVSLREIRRVNIFYEFFYKYLKSKNELYSEENQNELFEEDYKFYINLDEFSIQLYSINLSIFICYYLRITIKEHRKELNQKMNDILNKNGINFDFLDLPLKEEKFIVNNIKLDKGIAKNRALLENIFSLFVAINTKVPIFIVGKPGCSKSLSMQLIAKSMQGTASEKPFFRKIPKSIIHPYQGSLSSTSKGVKNIFDKARETIKQLNIEEKKNIISLIFFDEMGLAEHSPNNPLKVIHSELEYDQNENDKQVAFVGISNWNLDAAKMNRGISISIPEPDEDDNKETAFTIGNSYEEVLALRYKSFFENLGITYYNYKQHLKKEHSKDGKEDFHGNRDFYHLVKNSARNMMIREANNSLNEHTLLESAIDSIERNFSGITFREGNNEKASLEIFKENFQKIYPDCPIKKEYDVLKRIKENINDLNSRYLLIASESSIGTFLVSSILEEEEKNFSLYIGSPFEQDLHSEEYALKVLNKIQTHMERGNILILKNMETVYPAMYDLFNQNFSVFGGKNYSRLAIGSNTNTFAYVDKNFRCIVNVDISKLEQEEAPFLNRFEKHIMSFDYLLNEELIKEAENIKKNIDGFFECKVSIFKAIYYDLKKMMINCSKEEIQALVYSAHKNGIKKENINDYVLEKIALTLPQDILVNLKLKGSSQVNNLEKILKFYKEGEHSNLSKFLEKTKNQKNIVYTFTGYLEEVIEEENKINNSIVGDIKKQNIKIIQLDSMKSEREFETLIDDYINEDKLKVCIIKFLPYECIFMEYIKYCIEKKLKENKASNKKLFVFIVYISRIALSEINDLDKKNLKEREEFERKILTITLSNLSGFYQIFIDNLNGNSQFKIDQILNMKSKKLLETLINPDEELATNIFTCISYMQYNIAAPYKGLSRDNYVDKLIEFISNNKRLRYLMNTTIFKRSFKKDEDIITKIFKEKNQFDGKEIEILSVIKKYLSNLYTKQLSLMYFKAEKDQFFSSLLTNEIETKLWPRRDAKNEANNDEEEEINLKKEELYEDKTIVEKIAKYYLETMVYNDGKTNIVEKIGRNKVNIIFGFKIPCIKPILDRILASTKENTLKMYRNNENELRNNIDPEEIENVKNLYFGNLNITNNSLFNLINKEEQLKALFNIFSNNEEEKQLYELLIDDYYSFYLNNNITKSLNKRENQEEAQDNILLMIDNFDNNIRYLKLMVKMRKEIINKFYENQNNPNKNLFEFSEIINWIESYSEEITLLQQIFLKLNMKIPELYEQIESIIKSDQIIYEISERNPGYTAIVNKVFFICLDSILRILTSKIEIYELPFDDFFDLINTNKEVLQNALQLVNLLKLRSKEVFSLQEILKIIDALYINNLANVNNVKTVIQYFKEETLCLQLDTKDKLCSNLETFYKTLEKIIGNLPRKKNFKFFKLLSMILLDEFKKIQYPKFRELILDIILKKDDLIKNCSQIFQIIIENCGIDSDPESMENNIEYIKEEKSAMFQSLNNEKNQFLEEVIMNIFERKITKYFELIPNLKEEELKKSYKTYYEQNKKGKNKTGIIFDKSFQFFEETIKTLNSISEGKLPNNEDNRNLLKLYSIVYVKKYLHYLANFIVNNYQELGNTKEIMKLIKNIRNKHFSKVIKIYIFKLIYNLKKRNYEEFKNFEFKQNGIEFYEEFLEQKNKNAGNIMLTYFFLPSKKDDYKKYNEILEAFNDNSNFSIDKKNLENLLKKYGLDLFLLVILNKVISDLPLDKPGTKELHNKLTQYTKSIFNPKKNPQYNEELSKLLFLFFDSKIYNEKTKPQICDENDKIDIKIFEALLYGFRFCANSLFFEKSEKADNKKFLYQSLLSKECKNTIANSMIPGIDNKEDLHITSLDSIKVHFDTFPDSCGCYVCSCGFYFNIDPCGFPTTGRTFNCRICGEKCGWAPKRIKDKGAPNHGMIKREGHYRIFKDMPQKTSQMNKWGDPDENIPNKLLDEYKSYVYQNFGKIPVPGFNPVDRDYFQKQDKKLRNLSIIGYRLLNFIAYNHLFYTYCLGNVSGEEMNKYLIDNCKILKIIQLDWDLLEAALKEKNISSVQIFLNLIFKDLSILMKKYLISKKDIERINFENDIEKLISQNLKNYSDYSKIYSEENQKLSNSDANSLKTLVTEVIHPSSEIYLENEFPMFKYFNYTNYKSEQDMMNKMENKDRYPLIRQLVNDSPDLKNLSYLPAFNEFTNYMVNNYSFKISREDAKKRVLENEEIVNEKDFNKKFGNFLEAWNHIKSKATKYKCRPVMEVKEKFTKKDTLINFLNDESELYYGMYIASACQNFIEWQNTFLQPIVDVNTFNGILNNYMNTIIKKIPVQEAKHDQIVLISESFKKNSKYIDFYDLIYAYSERNIFGENGKINYSDYNNFVYDFETMEEELGKIILPGVCLFEGENELNFVTYWGEGFRGGNSSMITKFYGKYPQKDLEIEEKKEIIHYISNMNKLKAGKNNVKKYDFKDFFGSMQILLFYLTEKSVMDIKEKIVDIITKAPRYLKLTNDCINFFKNEGKNFCLNKIMNLFFYFEHLCFEDLAETLQPEYKALISEDIKNKIIEKLIKKKKQNDIIPNKNLGSATRRLISRYLAGKVAVTDVEENRDLAFELSRPELWEEKIGNLEDLMDLINDKILEFKLTVGQAYEFYNIIGEDDRNTLNINK